MELLTKLVHLIYTSITMLVWKEFKKIFNFGVINDVGQDNVTNICFKKIDLAFDCVYIV